DDLAELLVLAAVSPARGRVSDALEDLVAADGAGDLAVGLLAEDAADLAEREVAAVVHDRADARLEPHLAKGGLDVEAFVDDLGRDEAAAHGDVAEAGAC